MTSQILAPVAVTEPTLPAMPPPSPTVAPGVYTSYFYYQLDADGSVGRGSRQVTVDAAGRQTVVNLNSAGAVLVAGTWEPVPTPSPTAVAGSGSGGGGTTTTAPTDLSLGTATATALPLNSSTGADVVLPAATPAAAGLFAAADKTKLDTYPAVYVAPVAAAPSDLSLGTATATTLPLNISTGTDVVLTAATATEAGLMTASDRVNTNFTPIAGLLALWAADPISLVAGAITYDANRAPTGFPVVWPDGGTGVYAATTVSSTHLGAVDAYTVTYVAPGGGGGVNATVTQPLITRGTDGYVTVRPARTVA